MKPCRRRALVALKTLDECFDSLANELTDPKAYTADERDAKGVRRAALDAIKRILARWKDLGDEIKPEEWRQREDRP